jgi:protein O-GlcNAc transferase
MNINKSFQSAVQYYQAGNLRQAERILKKIAKGRPDFDVYLYLGNILQNMGQREEAMLYYRKAIGLKPEFAGTYYNIAAIMQEEGRLDEAIAHYRKVLDLDPGYAGTYNSIGVAFQSKGQYDEAMTYFRKAIEIDPDFIAAYSNLGNVLLRQEYPDEAMACYRKALDLNPNYAKAYCSMGIALQEKGLLDEAMTHYQKAIQLDPNLAEAVSNLGRVYHARGLFDDAETYYRRALQLKPDFSLCYSNLLLLMNYSSRHTPEAVFAEHLQFAEQCAAPLSSAVMPHSNVRSPSRRLKIGYVSPDFRRHSVNYFLEPVLAAHTHEQYEVFCYSDVLVPDTVTERLQGYADQWRNIAGMPDEHVAELIRKDGIDILMDLAGHTGYNRMLLFARKPAPVQVSWLGYPNTTGLSTIDYRIVDGYTDPPGLTDPFYTEQLVRMPESFLCYLPDNNSPVPGGLQAMTSGHITFGSFSNFTKETPEVLALWAEMLASIPDSRLLLKAKGFSDRETRDRVAGVFTGKDIDSGRIELVEHETSFSGHLGLYNRIDIALDPFPYNGTTTTCEALWMGVPVITLAGNTHASRVGMSLLTNIGLPEFVATTSEEYLAMAVNLANDLNRLQLLRESLRDRMNTSVLMNAESFTANLESCYRAMWQNYCVGQDV